MPRLNVELKKIILKPADKEDLTAYGDEFYIPKVLDGQDVLIGHNLAHGQLYLRCDYASFAQRLKDITPEKLGELFDRDGKLEGQAPALTEDIRKLVHACWRAGRITRKMLGDTASEHRRSESFNDYAAKAKDGRNICLKPLSECRGTSVCSEYALLAHHILDKLGIGSSIIVGAFADSPQDPLAGRHTYLVLRDGEYVFDPTQSAKQEDSWPPKVFLPEVPLTIKALKDLGTEEDKPFGRKIICKDLLTATKNVYGSGAS